MKAKLDCVPCVLRQVLRGARYAYLPEETQERVIRESMKAINKISWKVTPPELAHVAHGILRKYAQGDPYMDIKMKSNDEALALYTSLKERVENSSDSLLTAVKIAIAGNIIDFGAMSESEIKISETVEHVLKNDFAINYYEQFKEDLKSAKRILYFADNAGEIVFDKLLIETLRKMKDYRITLVVKAGPIINDATMIDVNYVGLNEMVDEVRFISNGEYGHERNSKEVHGWIKNHDMIISKGQGNYEGLSEFSGIYYLLMVKCPVVAEDIGANVGDVVLLYK